MFNTVIMLFKAPLIQKSTPSAIVYFFELNPPRSRQLFRQMMRAQHLGSRQITVYILTLIGFIVTENQYVVFLLDINECDPADPCHANATCTNTMGSYICACNANFSGDGVFCEGNLIIFTDFKNGIF